MHTAIWTLESSCSVATVAQRAPRSCFSLRQQRASRTPPRVSTNRSERKPLWGFILPGSRRTRRTKTHWWHLSWVSWYSRSNHSACCRPQLKRRAELWGPWLSLLPFWKKQVRFHRMGGASSLARDPPPILSGPLFHWKFLHKKSRNSSGQKAADAHCFAQFNSPCI